MIPSFPTLPLRLVAALVLFLACHLAAASAAAQDSHILRLDDTPEDTVWRLQARVRHTTVITLPARETILDYVVGDAEYWHLTGSANVAFLKPISADVETNIALVCESGRIYTFLVAESADLEPHLVVRFHDSGAGDGTTDLSGPAPRGAHQPAFVARSRIQSYQTMATQARADLQADACRCRRTDHRRPGSGRGRNRRLPRTLPAPDRVSLHPRQESPRVALSR